VKYVVVVRVYRALLKCTCFTWKVENSFKFSYGRLGQFHEELWVWGFQDRSSMYLRSNSGWESSEEVRASHVMRAIQNH
jgi:hypothetical protein